MANQLYTVGGWGSVTQFPSPVGAPRDPTSTDTISPTGQSYPVFQPWQNVFTSSLFFYAGGGQWIELTTSGTGPIEKLNVQTGTTPIVSSSGAVTINGSVVDAGTNPIRTDGTDANTMAVEVQRTQAIAAPNAANIGLAAFNSTYFSVDNTGFTSLTGNSSFIWIRVTGTTQTLAVNRGYYCTNAGLTTLILPTTSAVGTIISVKGAGAGNWRIIQNAGQSIIVNNQTSLAGTAGYVQSSSQLIGTEQFDEITLLCTIADTVWTIIGGLGNFVVNTNAGLKGTNPDGSQFSANIPGGSTGCVAYNSDNTNSASSAYMQAMVGGTSSGDPYFISTILGGQSWSWGLKNSLSDQWQLCTTSDLTGTPVLSFSTTGVPAFSGAKCIIKQARQSVSPLATTNAVIPTDDTIPQQSEGTEFTTLSITPSNSSNILLIEFNANVGISTAAAAVTLALFQDATADAICARSFSLFGVGITQGTISCYMPAGTTSATTFKIRFGTSNSSNNANINGSDGVHFFGAAMQAVFTITELQV